jgi:hypothetical protein
VGKLSIFPFPRSNLILNDQSNFTLEIQPEGITLFSNSQPLFELKEPVLLAQGISEGLDQIHLAYLKATGELCYSIISTTGAQQTTTLGKLDTKTNRYDQLILLPVNKVIHIFYATSYAALPDVWRITHLFWNGQIWQSAQLGEVVHPRHPLYHVLVDSKSNLHVLMMTFLGNRSVLLSSFFNGTFFVWSKRQESLSIPREIIDMTALITPSNKAFVFWAAKQPASDKFEINFATLPKADDFTSTWQNQNAPIVNISGPWKGLGILYSEGVLSLLINSDQARLVQFKNQTWNFISSSSTQNSALTIVQRSESIINYSNWLKNTESNLPVFNIELGLPFFNSAAKTPENPSSLNELEEFLLEPKMQANSNLPFDSSDSVSSGPSRPSDLPKDSLAESLGSVSQSSTQKTDRAKDLVALIHGIGEKVDSIPVVLDSLIRKNEETLETLRLVEAKVNKIQSDKEAANKKGFWGRWFT